MNNNDKKENKKFNVFIFFFMMLIAFIIIDMFVQFLSIPIETGLTSGKYASDFIYEALLAGGLMIVMLIFNNSYVFTQKKENFLKSLLMVFPILLIGLFNLLNNIGEINSKNFYDLISLVFYCGAIGLYEEFLCRGWLQNEFMERYSNDRRQVITSIALASLVFGAMHIVNVLAGQTLIDTICQIIHAFGLGFLLGSLYFRTKNIWACVFVHGFWDFALFLGELNVIKDCTFLQPSNGVIVYNSIGSILLSVSYVVLALFILRKSKTNDLMYEKEELTESSIKELNKKSNILLVLYFLLLVFPIPMPDDINDYTVCYNFTNKEYNVMEYNYSSVNQFVILGENGKVEVLIEDSFVRFKDIESGYIYKLNYKAQDLRVFNNDNKYSFIIQYIDDLGDSVIYYSDFLEIGRFKLDDDFLNEFSNSFKKYDLPKIIEFGYANEVNDSYKYPYFLDRQMNRFIIDKDNELYLASYKVDVKDFNN